MSLTFRFAVTASAMTEMSSAAWRPTIDPPSTTPVAGRTGSSRSPGIVVDQGFALAENGTFVTRIFRPSANASASARPTSAISGSVKIADAALS